MENELITDNFNIYLALPSSLAVFISLVIICTKRWRNLLLENKFIAIFFASLLGMNLIEVVTYSNLFSNFDILLRLYYCLVVLLISSLLCLSERLNNHSIPKLKYFYLFIYTSSILLFIIILASDYFVSGANLTNVSILRQPGDYYFLILLYLMACILTAIFLIILSIKKANNPLNKKRHIVILYSLLPLVFTLTLVFIFIQIESTINLSFFLPICTLLFLIVYLFTENKRDLFRVLVNIPYSQERQAYKEVNDQVIEYLSKTQTDEQISLKEAMATIEKAFIARALEIKDGDHNLAAELLSISMSTIYRKEERPDQLTNRK